MHIYSDFDGTISTQDATDVILNQFADPAWEAIEEEWQQGAIGSAECMQRQIALIRTTRQELDHALDKIAIDPGFSAFIEFCQATHIPVTIISDGVDYFIQRILARHHLEHLPIIANRLIINESNDQTNYLLSSPYSNLECETAAGVCKCRTVASPDMRIYIGDGRSDFCVSNKPDLIFAKDKLAEYCTRQGIAFIPYRQFADITRALPALTRRMPESINYVAA